MVIPLVMPPIGLQLGGPPGHWAGGHPEGAIMNNVNVLGAEAGSVNVSVWDLPVRLFHWLLVASIATSWATAELGWMRVHFLSGYTILTLLLFRLGWGIIGSDSARF